MNKSYAAAHIVLFLAAGVSVAASDSERLAPGKGPHTTNATNITERLRQADEPSQHAEKAAVDATQEDELLVEPSEKESTHMADDWPAPARYAGKVYHYLLHQKLDIGFRTTRHKLKETDRGEPFDGSFIGSIDQLRLLPDESPSYQLVFRYAPIPYAGIGYQTDELVIRTQTSIPRERRISDRDTDGNLILKGSMPFVFVRYNILNWIEPYAEYGRASFDNSFDPDPWWFSGGYREFVVEDSTRTSYWSVGLGVTIGKHIVLDFYTRSIKIDVDAIYYFRGDDRAPEPFVFPASHRTHGFTASVRF